MSDGIKVSFDDVEARAALNRMLSLGRNPQPLLLTIARLGESQTRERFATETDPDGQKWLESERKKTFGGRTLTLNGILANSITSQATIEYAEWGTNVKYAAIHNFGGVIKPLRGEYLAFSLAGGGFAKVKSVTMPKRTFMGVNEANKAEILATTAAKIRKLQVAT